MYVSTFRPCHLLGVNEVLDGVDGDEPAYEAS